MIRSVPLAAAALLIAAPLAAQSLPTLASGELAFTLDTLGPETRAQFVEEVAGTSNGIPYVAVSTNGDAVFLGFTNVNDDQAFNELPQTFDAIHTGTNITITFDQPVQMLLVATANDNATGDGFDFGMMPVEMVDLEALDGSTFLRSLDFGGTLALFVADDPMTEWVSESENDIRDGIDLAFFAFTPEMLLVN